jgi:rRNA maturation RNase YbeY
LRKVLKDLGCHEGELSILFTDDAGIAELNERYLGRKGPTNVLAFPMSGGPPPDAASGMLGDVVVSFERAMDESHQSGEPFIETVYRLLIHGILHLLSYDHEASSEEADRMEEEEVRLLSMIKEG